MRARTRRAGRLVWLGAVACLLAGVPGVHAGERLTLASAINKAGRQRMLTQRTVKLYCLRGISLERTRIAARERQHHAMALFEQQLAELQVFASRESVARSLADVQRLWVPFAQLAAAEVDRDRALELVEADERLLEASDAVVTALEALSDRPHARLVNISGRQRMLSQRVAKFYLLIAWGFEDPALQAALDEARYEFEGGLAELRAAPENTSAIGYKLEEAAEQWRWLSSALDLREELVFYPTIVEDAAERMLAIMEEATRYYEEIFEQQTAARSAP